MKRILILAATFALTVQGLSAQTAWTLQQCIDYALENNNTILINKNNYLSGMEDTQQARAAMLPSLSASSSQGVANHPFGDDSNTRYTGSYGVNANMTLWNGGSLRTAVRQQEVANSLDSLDVESSMLDIKISIIQTYLQCLYAAEAITVNESTVQAAKAQLDRANALWKSGLLSKVDVAQLESQVANNEYQLVSSRGNLEGYKLQLKQLLQLGIDRDMELSGEDATEDEVLRLLPAKSDIYYAALEIMPEIARGKLAITSAELARTQARTGFMPSLGLSAGIGTSNISGTGNNFTSQLQDNLNENAGITLSIPIFSNRRNKTALNKARIAVENSKINQMNLENSLQKSVENTYHDAISAQAQYVSAKEQEKYARQSYDLTSEQFNVGMKNIVELITAQNSLLQAQQSRLQAKYMALMNLNVLDIYQGIK